jgi:hypothetical protein
VAGGLAFHHVERVTKRAQKLGQPDFRQLNGFDAQNGHWFPSRMQMAENDLEESKSHAA